MAAKFVWSVDENEDWLFLLGIALPLVLLAIWLLFLLTEKPRKRLWEKWMQEALDKRPGRFIVFIDGSRDKNRERFDSRD